MEKTKKQIIESLDDFTRQYLQGALWTGSDDLDKPLYRNH